MQAIAEALLSIDLFAGLSPFQLTEIARRADRLIYQPGDVLLARDEDPEGSLIIIDGEAVCLRGPADEPIEEPVAAGSVLADMAMIVEYEAAATVVARARVRALRVNRADLLEILAEDAELSEALIEAVTVRLRSVAAGLRAIESELAETTDHERGDGTGADVSAAHAGTAAAGPFAIGFDGQLARLPVH
ncbi:MAG: cyclic nucleotide-binding domain-containing protein [Pseudomonadota bacterium]